MRLLLAMLLLPTLAFASEVKRYEVLGFSPDDAYAALMEHGVNDASGLPWATVTIYRVAKGSPALPPIRVEPKEGGKTEADVIAEAKQRADAARESLHVAAWVPATPIVIDPPGSLRFHDEPVGSVELQTRPVKSNGCPPGFKPQQLTARLFFLDDETPVKLYSEQKPPPQRKCGTDYALDGVFAHGKSALFVLRYRAPGFEGTNLAHFAFAKRLPYPLAEK